MTVRALDDVTSTLIIVPETVMNGDKMLNVQLLLLIQDDLLKFDNPFVWDVVVNFTTLNY